MKDPWRVVDPVHVPARPARVDLDSQDFDADLRPHVSCILRFKSCSIEISSPELTKPRDALAALATCVLELKRLRNLMTVLPQFGDCNVRACVGLDVKDMPTSADVAAKLEKDDVTVLFPAQTLDAGALALVRVLIKASHKPVTAAILRKHGITPMLRST